MLRGWAVLAIAASASAFTATPALAPVNSRIAVTSLRMSSGRVNKKIELDSPKVASQEKLEPGSKAVYCRCWLSDTFPKCDGKHMKHNEATGDNLGPLIVSVS